MAVTMSSDSSPFYKANIHERRFVALLCRAFPLLSVLIVTSLALYGTFKETLVLLWVTAIFSMTLWLWVVTTAVQSIYATLFLLKDLELGPGVNHGEISDLGNGSGTSELVKSGNTIVHFVALPNFKEDESMLAETLRSLAEAEGSQSFWIILAMEAREGEEGKTKATRLRMRFEGDFARIIITHHPDDLVEDHMDGSRNPEVPGKAANLKYAINQAYRECAEVGIHHDCVLLTVADADCILHPLYFRSVGEEFRVLREVNQHSWTMWSAPQFPYRNFYTSPIVSRVWGYLQSTYEFGGLAGTAWGGHHMAFSSYSLPLSLAHDAEAWDGDVVAEDHHAWLKCFYYWVHTALNGSCGNKSLVWEPKIPTLRLRPIFLPTKSTAVANTEAYWKSWVDRWMQAKRHAQGVSELSYALLATYDACQSSLLPKRIFSPYLFYRMGQVLLRIWCMHVLPICQSICLTTLTIKWLWNNRHIELCPDRLWFFGDLGHWGEQERYLLCGLAGAWVLTWPVVIPAVLMVASNVLIIYKGFLMPAMLNRYASIWHSEDAKVPGESRGTLHLIMRTLLVVVFDFIFGMSWILVPYGLFVEIIAYFNVFIFGNCHFSYVTASKGVASKKLPSSYGAICGRAPATKFDEPLKQQPIMID